LRARLAPHAITIIGNSRIHQPSGFSHPHPITAAAAAGHVNTSVSDEQKLTEKVIF